MGQINHVESQVKIRGFSNNPKEPTVQHIESVTTTTIQDPQLAVKYQRSWDGATEAQRKGICIRFGIQYTQKEDKNLLIVVANRQQEEYDRVFNKLDDVLSKVDQVMSGSLQGKGRKS